MTKKYPEKLGRINLDFEKELRQIAKERYTKDLDIEELPLPEITRIMRTAPSWDSLLKELKTLPHKDKLKR